MRSVGILICTAALAVLSIGGCGGGGSPLPGTPTELRPEDLVPDVTVQVVDHRFRNASLSDVDLDSDPIFALIASASASLDVALPSINRQEVVTALLSEAASGTRVRIITEKAFYDDPVYKPFYDQLQDPTRNGGNLTIHTDKEGLPRLMHDRFLIIDQARVVTGSYNWESESADRTFGDVITLLNTGIAAAFTSQFNQMFVEGNFGVHKRNASQHSFLVGSGNGLVEVYFGPTDQPQALLESEIGQSRNVSVAIQQFKDVGLANYLLGFLNTSTDNHLVLMINNTLDTGDQEENNVYNAFVSYLGQSSTDVVGSLLLSLPFGFEGNDNGLLTSDQQPQTNLTGNFADYNTMNHKLLIADHALSDNSPATVFSTANYSDLGFTQNDEVMLVLRGRSLTNKYFRTMALNAQPPATVTDSTDVKEMNQLMAMWPFLNSANITPGTDFRDFIDTDSAIVFGQVSNFKPIIKRIAADGTEDDIAINATFTIRGKTFFNQIAFGGDPRKVFDPNTTHDPAEEARLVFPNVPVPFNSSELSNPDHRYLLIVPAGEITVSTIVLESGMPSDRFTIGEKHFFVGPGGVRQADLQIGQLVDKSNTGGGGGGGGGTGA